MPILRQTGLSSRQQLHTVPPCILHMHRKHGRSPVGPHCTHHPSMVELCLHPPCRKPISLHSLIRLTPGRLGVPSMLVHLNCHGVGSLSKQLRTRGGGASSQLQLLCTVEGTVQSTCTRGKKRRGVCVSTPPPPTPTQNDHTKHTLRCPLHACDQVQHIHTYTYKPLPPCAGVYIYNTPAVSSSVVWSPAPPHGVQWVPGQRGSSLQTCTCAEGTASHTGLGQHVWPM